MRQSGRTTLQLASVPQGGRYLWVSNRFCYPQQIAQAMGRGDIRFVGPSWLLSRAWEGEWVGDLTIDHAVEEIYGQRLREAFTSLRVRMGEQRTPRRADTTREEN